jgi:hypothetical protein
MGRMNPNLTADLMKRALSALEQRLRPEFEKKLRPQVLLIMGGGGAMVLAHDFPLSTTDIDAVPRGIEFADLDPYVKSVAEELDLPVDWLNPYFSSFSHVLSPGFMEDTIVVFDQPALKVVALGKTDMLIMKCFAHRRKDVGHGRALVRGGADLDRVESRIEELLRKRIPHAEAALDFLQELTELEGK